MATKSKPTASKQTDTKTSTKKSETETPQTKDAPAKDQFGCREGSQAARINAALSTTKGKTYVEIAAETNAKVNSVTSHLRRLQGLGLLTVEEGKVKIAK